ncbi:hypothetical protein BTA51_16635 [Hahella sp. CCB-MM4]|uniref:hypothetical protein n=1 Tax=Hahella sp. (strain CCB-MM4) TaxID=1926491 RepID=UPI000B9AC071|nr:hypothetical protein [Hahella sp. CCB-MM4]OZG72356.1 hypothetical protein BTA51_16635 [Hahella sp. CCB-MM4]
MDIAKKYKSGLAAFLLAAVSGWYFYINQPSKAVSQSLDVQTEDVAKIPDPMSKTEDVSSEAVPESFPVPAKKLHQVINNQNDSPEAESSLNAKIEHMNQELEAIDEQLSATPSSSMSNDQYEQKDSLELESRLLAIKEHLRPKTQ